MSPNDWDSVWMYDLDFLQWWSKRAPERSLNPQASREHGSGQEAPLSPSIGGGAALSGEAPLSGENQRRASRARTDVAESQSAFSSESGGHGAQGDPVTRLSSPDETLATETGGSPSAPLVDGRPAGHPAWTTHWTCMCGTRRLRLQWTSCRKCGMKCPEPHGDTEWPQ